MSRAEIPDQRNRKTRATIPLCGNKEGKGKGNSPLTRTEVLNFVIVRSNAPHNLLLRRTAMQRMGIIVSTIHGAIKFYTPRGIGTVLSTYEQREKKLREASLKIMKGVLHCVDAKERIVVNDKYPDQMVVVRKQLPTNFKKKLQDLLRSNADIQMVEEDEYKTAFFAGKGIFYYQKMPFGLKNTGATYQRLVDKVFSDQIGRNHEAYVDDMAESIIEEIHEGSYGFNMEPRSMIFKVMKQGYYWPSMYMDAAKTIQDCTQCQAYFMMKKASNNDAITLLDESLFEAWEGYKLLIDQCPNHNMLLVTQIDTFYNGLTLRHPDTIDAAAGGTFISTTSSSSEIAALAQQMIKMRKYMLQTYRSNQQVNSVTPSCETCGGPHSYYECQAAGDYTQDVYATTRNYNSGGGARPEADYGPGAHFKSRNLAEALALMPKYANMLKDLLSNNEKLLGLKNTSLTENCLAILLKKLPEKLKDPGKFLIPYDFPELEKCMALANLGASINLIPLYVWQELILPELIPTRMTIELANRFVAYPADIADDVCIQVGKFTFPTDFVVVDYDINLCVPLILGRPFLRTARALADEYGEELQLRDDDEKLIFHADSTLKYPHKHGNEAIDMINFTNIT
uniref:Reverse transcriptase domain-containing protein n=1 Tax=Tanacetum cinerariifolium TaxID=118510 RepID=A0A6L2MNH2_TANCI|nr:reverse transcriptase domain-containing protein [Tanacetum cinerariifolium]